MGLILKFLKAGYIEDNKSQPTILGLPQGGILSPMFSNLYLTPFDEFMDTLQIKYNSRTLSDNNNAYRRIECHISKLKRKIQLQLLKSNSLSFSDTYLLQQDLASSVEELHRLSSLPRVSVNIQYVRYADD